MGISIYCLILSLTKITKDVCKISLRFIGKNVALCIDNRDPTSDAWNFVDISS